MYKKSIDTTKQAQRPLLLSEQKWNSILDHLIDRKSIQSCEEKQYFEYLKNGSKIMTKNWINTIAKSIERVKEKKNAYQDKINEDLRLLSKIKEQDENMRRIKIQKANLMIQKLLPGSRELESAAMFCEVLRGREIQIDLNRKIKNQMDKDKTTYDKILKNQGSLYMEEGQKRNESEQGRKSQFKKDLCETMKKNKERNEACRKIRHSGERKMLELIKEETRTFEKKKKAAEIAKQNISRQQILEDILQMKEKCRRMKIEDQIAEELNKAHNEKHEKVEFMVKNKFKKEKCERICFIEQNAKKHNSNIAELKKIEEQRRLKQIEEEKKKCQIREIEEEIKRKLTCELRSQEYNYYMKQKEKYILEQTEISKWELANRLKNSEVNEDYIKQAKALKMKKLKETKYFLEDQMKEQNTIKEYERFLDNQCNTMNSDLHDQFYFEYGEQLIENARSKCRPLFPLQNAIVSYKRKHGNDRNIFVPPKF